MPTVLSRDTIQSAKDISIEFVKVPEWSDDPEAGVFVKGLTGTERDSFEMAMIEQRQKGKRTREVNLRNLRAKLIVRTAVDSDDTETAKHIFTLLDVDWLGKKSAAALQRVYDVAQRLSGLSSEDVDELTIDLGNGQSDASGSDSPSLLGIEASPMPSDGSVAESLPNGSPTTDSNLSETGGSTT